MGFKVFLCASAYPEREETVKKVGIDVTDCLSGFVKAIGRNEILPFFGAYQRMVYSYMFFKNLICKHDVDFVFVTGGSTLIPKTMAHKTIVYAHFPIDVEVASQHYLNSRMKKLYIKPWKFISNNANYIKKATIITNSRYTKNAIKDAWGSDATVIYPPCPQYSFPLTDRKENMVCSIGRFTPEKNYEFILDVAQRLPNIKFELIGSVTTDKIPYLEKLKKAASGNVKFHVNISVPEKIDILKRAKCMLHSFVGEHFGIAIIEAKSAGVIPITHDSGAAQVDQLVEDKFRYIDTEGAIKSVMNAIDSWSLEETTKLREFAKQFSAESFNENLRTFISNWIVTHGIK
jgi:alpha-1,2-mannosyltransferase